MVATVRARQALLCFLIKPALTSAIAPLQFHHVLHPRAHQATQSLKQQVKRATATAGATVSAPRSPHAPPPAAARPMAATAGSSSQMVPALALAGAFFFFVLVAPAVVAADEAAAPPGLGFHVGGPRGWRVPDANTSYDWWATNNRFHVGDRLYFRYANDSVVVVDREAFEACNATEPIATFADGATTFVLDRPGFFCFVSGEPGHCEQGQRLIVRVMVHPALAAPGPASAPGASSAQPGGHPWLPGTSSGAAASAGGVPVAVALAGLVGLALMLQ